jgi:hypothetical protein
MPITITKPEVAKILNPTHDTGEVEALYKIATLLVGKMNADLVDLASNVSSLALFKEDVAAWSSALAEKLNEDSGVNDEDYTGIPIPEE